eukprot:TRINITY_DN27582_c0_g3_i1.p1 TRINITY_DN27582_c0_g3~~TRINITY_DN27582_c0_g3_i1.p1  ORF type:complete len:277 (+),score=62.61 TRINITY_DN27582_c0_g3_i1:96-833(+)
MFAVAFLASVSGFVQAEARTLEATGQELAGQAEDLSAKRLQLQSELVEAQLQMARGFATLAEGQTAGMASLQSSSCNRNEAFTLRCAGLLCVLAAVAFSPLASLRPTSSWHTDRTANSKLPTAGYTPPMSMSQLQTWHSYTPEGPLEETGSSEVMQRSGGKSRCSGILLEDWSAALRAVAELAESGNGLLNPAQIADLKGRLRALDVGVLMTVRAFQRDGPHRFAEELRELLPTASQDVRHEAAV